MAEVEPGKGWEGVLIFCLSFSLPKSPLSLSSPMSFSVLFSSPVLLRRVNERVAGWASGTWPRSAHHNTIYCGKILGA